MASELNYTFVAFKSRLFRINEQSKVFTETWVRHFGGEIPAAWAELPASVGALCSESGASATNIILATQGHLKSKHGHETPLWQLMFC